MVSHTVARLSFNKRITPIAAGKPIPVGDLLKRLKELHEELSSLEQENVDLQSLTIVRKDLIHPSLLSHKDKGVKVFTACCLADVLRLYAPDAPYQEKQLLDIFNFFVNQLSNIGDQKHTYFSKYYYLLDSLAQVKSTVLVADLNSDDLVVYFFKTFFNVVRPDLSKNIHVCIVSILEQIILESKALPHEVVSLIIGQFTKKEQDKNPASHALAADLCRVTADQLQKYVCQYFAEEIVSAGRASGPNDDEDEDEEDDRRDGGAMGRLERAHALILEINREAPAVLLNVVPQVEEELKTEDAEIRKAAVDVLGDVFAQSTNTAAIYPHVWQSWLRRKGDKDPLVRVRWLEKALAVVRVHPDFAGEISGGIEEKLLDPDEKVRVSACKAVGQIDAQISGCFGERLIKAAGERLKDKKTNVRNEAFNSLSKLFNLMYDDIASPVRAETNARGKYGWIPGEILATLYLDDPDVKFVSVLHPSPFLTPSLPNPHRNLSPNPRILVEKALHEEILPPHLDDKYRAERLLNVMSLLNEKQWKGFVSVLERQVAVGREVEIFVEVCEKFNGGIVDDEKEGEKVEKQLGVVVRHIASKWSKLRQPLVVQALIKFAKVNDQRVYKLLKSVMDPQAEYKHVVKTVREIIKRLEPHGTLLETFHVILRRISLTLVSKNSIPHLIEKVQQSKRSRERADVEMGSVAERVLKDVTSVFPMMYKGYLE
ncbi:hypothetical protein HK097_008638, partial [Rhizophlyctis rosea]